jgi:hypothetical protein
MIKLQNALDSSHKSLLTWPKMLLYIEPCFQCPRGALDREKRRCIWSSKHHHFLHFSKISNPQILTQTDNFLNQTPSPRPQEEESTLNWSKSWKNWAKESSRHRGKDQVRVERFKRPFR